ncbi:MAG: aminoacetone oxidase family FAD-binding enzyme [Candidatus Absconditabacteria bacterium]
MIYDIIVVGAGASGLFFASQLENDQSVLMLEQSDIIGLKLLMSGGERCNFSNSNVSPEHYFGTKKESLHSMFKKFSYQNIETYLQIHGIETVEENNGRLILKSGKAKDIVQFFTQLLYKKDSTILTKHEVLSVHKAGDIFTVETNQGSFEAKNIVLATGGKSFPQIGASDIGRSIAQSFGHSITDLHPGLCGIETRKDVSPLSGSSCEATISLLDGSKNIYENTGPLLFTHRGFSGPTIFNTTIALGDYRKQGKNKDKPINTYSLAISINPNTVTKKIKLQFGDKVDQLIFPITQLRPRTEAKITVGGIPITELLPSGESKKCPGLFVLGELVDITGETGGFNLQRCWTSAYLCAENFNKKSIVNI